MQTVRTILAVDDDPVLLGSYERAFAREQRRVFTSTTIAAARRIALEIRPDLVLVDLRIGSEWGIDLIAALRVELPDAKLALVSGYLSVASTVAALRAGASHVMFKPVTGRAILEEIERDAPPQGPARDHHPSLARIEWEYIMRVLADTSGNVSEAARRLGIRRQSLQQRLKKPVPPS